MTFNQWSKDFEAACALLGCPTTNSDIQWFYYERNYTPHEAVRMYLDVDPTNT